jgi:signal transduction histidine kinase
MSEYSCRLLRGMLGIYEDAGYDLAPAFDGLSFDRAYVGKTRNWVSWNEAIELFERILAIVGSRDEFLDLIREHYGGKSGAFGYMVSLARLIHNPRSFYVEPGISFMKRQITIYEISSEALPDGRIRVSASIPETYRGSLLYFELTAVGFAVLPKMIGLPPAQVEAEFGPHHINLIVKPPASQTIRARLKFAGFSLFNQSRIFEHLESDADALVAKQRDIEQLNRELRTLMERAVYPVVLLEGGKIRFSNNAFQSIVRLSAADCLELSFFDFVRPTEHGLFSSWLLGSNEDRDDVLRLGIVPRVGDGLVHVHAHHRPEMTFEGRRVSMLSLRDVTRELALERELHMSAQNERESISRELHDDLGQQLSSLSLLFEGMARREQLKPHSEGYCMMRTALDEAIQATRSVARDLQPVPSAPGGFAHALRRLASSSSVAGSDVTVCAEIDDEVAPDPFVANQLYRIAQEAVSNAIRHAAASRIRVVLQAGEDGYCLSIEDNGCGFAPDCLQRGGAGLGIENMQKRAQMADIRWDLTSAPDEGCRVSCIF